VGDVERDYGPRAYQAFVIANPGGRVPAIERRITAALFAEALE
jgi:hypothetical protein